MTGFSLALLVLKIAAYAIPIGIVVFFLAMLTKSQQLEKASMFLLLTGGICLLLSVPLCSIGFFNP